MAPYSFTSRWQATHSHQNFFFHWWQKAQNGYYLLEIWFLLHIVFDKTKKWHTDCLAVIWTQQFTCCIILTDNIQQELDTILFTEIFAIILDHSRDVLYVACNSDSNCNFILFIRPTDFQNLYYSVLGFGNSVSDRWITAFQNILLIPSAQETS
jgi:hypothetical protein